ncbi:LysE family translocator, partial [Streptomyces rubiginosohelvolus]
MVSDIEWAAFFPSAILLAATPGANQLLILRNGLRHGPRPAISASTGRFAAFALMVVAVAAGLGAVLTASEVAFNAIKWCGVVYLLWLGGRTMLTAVRKGTTQ